MAQLPLKFSTTFYINHATATVAYHHYNPPPSPTPGPTFVDLPALETLSSSSSSSSSSFSSSSSSQSTRDSRFSIKSISHFFHILKRSRRDSNANCNSSSPPSPSPRKHRFIACFSNAHHDAPTTDICARQPSWGSFREDATDDDDDDETKIDSASDFSFVICEDSNAEEMQGNNMEIVEFSAGMNDFKDNTNRGLEIVSSLDISHVHGFSLFMAKLLKAVNNSGSQFSMITSKDAKRWLEVIMVTVKQKGMKKVSAMRKKKNDCEKFWNKPIIMGRRCRKLAEDFPYDDDVAVEEFEFPRVSISSIRINSCKFSSYSFE